MSCCWFVLHGCDKEATQDSSSGVRLTRSRSRLVTQTPRVCDQSHLGGLGLGPMQHQVVDKRVRETAHECEMGLHGVMVVRPCRIGQLDASDGATLERSPRHKHQEAPEQVHAFLVLNYHRLGKVSSYGLIHAPLLSERLCGYSHEVEPEKGALAAELP